MVEHYKALLEAVDPELQPLTCCHVHRLYLTLKPASIALCWNAHQTTWNRFFTESQKSLEEFRQFCIRLEDLRKNRICLILDCLTNFSLCPEVKEGAHTAMTLDQFIVAVRESCRTVTVEIQQRNLALEKNINELAELVWQPCKDPARFFQIATEAIVFQSDKTVERLKPPGQLSRRSRHKSVKMDSAGSPVPPLVEKPRRASLAGSLIVERMVKTLSKSSSKASSSGSLPHLNLPSVSQPPVPVKSQSTTRLPKIVSRCPSASGESREVREGSTVSLPPLTGTSTQSMVCASLTDLHNAPSTSEQSDAGISISDSSSDSGASDYSMLIQQLEKAIKSWKRMYSKKILQVLVTWIRSQLDQLRHRIVPSANMLKSAKSNLPLFQLQAFYNYNYIEVTPSLDEVQEMAHTAGKMMLTVMKGISRWVERASGSGKVQAIRGSSANTMLQTYNIYGSVIDNKDVAKGISRLASCLLQVKCVS